MSAIRHPVTALPALLLFAATGCTRYAYDLVSPPDLQQTIDGKTAAQLPIGPVVYDLQTAEDRLVMTIHNDADDAVKLVGEDSYVVDPRGESHPLPTRTIAPRAATKLIFPPLNPSLQRGGPVFGFGVGVGFSSAGGRSGYGAGLGAYDDFGQGPRYYSLDREDAAVYWNSTGTGTIRMRLAYEGADAKRFTHEFEFVRRKA